MTSFECDCAVGITGFQGDSGVPGIDGDRGFQGFQGFQGRVGQFGSSGSQGLSGVSGQNGKNGPMGYPGRDGTMGYAGSAGIIGPPGPMGPPGIPGQDGAPGPVGYRGYEGAVGPRGPAGTPGSRGDRGFQGLVGSQGSAGTQGSSAGFNLVMESARTQGGVASSVVSVNDGDKVRLWSAGGLSIGLASGSALYNLEPNNMKSAIGSPSLAPADPFRPSIYINTVDKSMWMWDPNSAGGSWIQQTGDGSNGYYGGGQYVKVSNVIPQALSSPVFVDLNGSTINLNISRTVLIKIEVFMVVSASTGYTLTGNFFQNGVALDGDPNLIFISEVGSANTQTIQHHNSLEITAGIHEIKYQLHLDIGENVTIDQHYMKVCIIGL